MIIESSLSQLSSHSKKNRNLFRLTLLSLYSCLVQGDIQGSIEGHKFSCFEDDIIHYTIGTIACVVILPSSIVSNSESLVSALNPPTKSKFLAIKYEHSSYLSYNTAASNLLWPELYTEHSQATFDSNSREIRLYNNITISRNLPNEESILGCLFDIFLLYADAQANGLDIEFNNQASLYFNINSKTPHCYLPSLVNSARKVIHGYRSNSEYVKDHAKVAEEINTWTYKMSSLAEPLSRLCNLDRDNFDFTVKNLRCRDPRFQLLHELLNKQAYLTTASFLDIVSLLTVFPGFPLAKKEKWLRYLKYRGFKEAFEVKNPVVAFVDGVVHPLFFHFAPHALLEKTGVKGEKENLEGSASSDTDTLHSEKKSLGEENLDENKDSIGPKKSTNTLIHSFKNNEAYGNKVIIKPSIYSIMGVSEDNPLVTGKMHLKLLFESRKSLSRYSYNQLKSLREKRENFQSQKQLKRIHQNFFIRSKKIAKETREEDLRISNFTVIALPMYSWRISHDKTLDDKSKEEIHSSLLQAVKENGKAFSSLLEGSTMKLYKGDPSIISQFLGQQKPSSLASHLRSHDEHTTLTSAVIASYKFMRMRNPSSYTKFLKVHPFVMRHFVDIERKKLNEYILRKDHGRDEIHNALNSAVTSYYTYLHFTFYDQMRAFDHSYMQLERRRMAIQPVIFENYHYSFILKDFPSDLPSHDHFFPIAEKVNVLRKSLVNMVQSLSSLPSLITGLEVPYYITTIEETYKHVVNEDYKKKEFISKTQSKERTILEARRIVKEAVAAFLKDTDLKGIWNHIVDKDSFKMEFVTPPSDTTDDIFPDAKEIRHVMHNYPKLAKYTFPQLISIFHFIENNYSYCTRRRTSYEEEWHYLNIEELIALDVQNGSFLAKLTSLNSKDANNLVFLLSNEQIVSRINFSQLDVKVSYENLHNDIGHFCSSYRYSDFSSYMHKARDYLNKLIISMRDYSRNRVTFFLPKLIAEITQRLEIMKEFVKDNGMISNF